MNSNVSSRESEHYVFEKEFKKETNKMRQNILVRGTNGPIFKIVVKAMESFGWKWNT